MLNNLVTRFLDPFLNQYFKVNSKKIEIELMNGKAQLKDLIFQEDSLIQHQIPLYIKRGLINSLSVTISSDQCNIFIENLILVGSEVYGSTIIPENQFIEVFTERTFIKQIIKSIISIFFDSSLKNMKKLFDNLTISIQKIHIRIEGLMNGQSLGIMFGSVNLYSVNDSMQRIIVKNHPSTFSKKIEIKNFSIYYDTENKYPINKYTDSFESQMIMQIANENEFIIHPISFECVFIYNTDFNTITNFKANLGELKLSFNNLQSDAFKKLINNIKVQRSLNFLGRPFKSVKSERSSTLWWCYSYRCIRYKKTNYQPLDITMALDVIKNRKKFYSLWKDYVLNPERNKKNYDDFKNTLNPNTLALLRYYSSFQFSRDTNNHSKLFTEDEIVKYFAKPKETIQSDFQITVNSIQFDLNLKIKNKDDSLVIEEEEEDNGNYMPKEEYKLVPLLGFVMDDIVLNGSKNKDVISILFETTSFYIKNYKNEKYRNTMELPQGVKGAINVNYSDFSQAIKLDIPSISGIFDVNQISSFIEYYTNTNIFNRTFERKSVKDKDVKNIIDTHPRVKLDILIGNSTLIIPYQEIENDTPILKISLDSFEIHSNSLSKYNINIIESLYDVYQLSLNSIQLHLNDKVFSNKINVKTNVSISIFPFIETDLLVIDNSISPLELHLTTFDSLLLYEIFFYLADELNISDDSRKAMNNLLPEFKIVSHLQLISFYFSFRETTKYSNTEAFKFTLKNETQLSVCKKEKDFNVSILNKDGVESLEFFKSDHGKFINSTKFELFIKMFESTTNVTINFGDFELYAKAVPLNFIQVFAESPKFFEWKLHLKEDSTIDKYFHKQKNQNEKSGDLFIDFEFKKTTLHFIDHEATNNKINETISNTNTNNNSGAIDSKNNNEKDLNNNNNYNGAIDSKNNDTNNNDDANKSSTSNNEVNNDDDVIMFSVTVDYVSAVIKDNEDGITFRLESDPPQAVTSQYGNIWSTLISKAELPSSPIVINITPTSVAFDLDYFELNIPPMILSKVTKFALMEKNPYSHIFGDPGTIKFLKFNLTAKKFVVKIVYDIESLNYYELNITEFKMDTLKPPYFHQILLDKIEVTKRNQNKNDDLILKLENLDFNLDMKLLLRDNVDIAHVDSFENLVKQKGIKEWTEETLAFLENKSNEKLFSYSFFYFYELDFKINFDFLSCTYSHELARNTSYVIFRVLDIMNHDSFFNNNNKNAEKIDEPLDICCEIKMKNGVFLIIDQTENEIARLSIDNAKAQVDPTKFLINCELDKINLVDNENDKILETGHLSIETQNKRILARLESFDLILKLKYLPDSVYYIMNCPLFSFVDEFQNGSTPTSFEMSKEVYFSLNKFKVTVPIQENIFSFETSFDVSLTPEGNIVQIRDIQLFLSDKLIIKKFSISFSNDIWTIEPIIVTFSVFEFHVIQLLVNEINSLKMPLIYSSKLEAELRRRKYVVQLQQIDLILTQPCLPFITLEIKPSTFKQGYNDENGGEKLIEYNVEMLLKHDNHSNYGIDTIIDPFNISVNSKIVNHQTFTKAEISPINIAISPYILAEILQFKKKYSLYKSSNQPFLDKIIFFQNDTGIPIRLFLKNAKSNKYEEFEIKLDTPFQINDYEWTEDIMVIFLNKPAIFCIKDLCFPIFYEKMAVVYLVADIGIQTIHFSSPYVIKNELSYSIDILIDDEYIGFVKPKSERAIPLTLLPQLTKGIQAAISPISAVISPPMKFKRPNQEAKLYKFVDSQNERNYYSSVIFQTDPQRSICYFTFLPYVTYTNQLPVPVSLTLLNKYDVSYHLETGQSIDVSFLKDKKSRLKIKVSVEPFGESEPTEVFTFSNSSTPSKISIKRNKEEKCKIAVMTDFTKKLNTYQIAIFAPCVMYNKTGALLSMKDSKDVFYPFINNMCFYTPDEYPKKVPLRILMREVTRLNSADINLIDAKAIQTFSLPLISNDNVFLLLSAVKVITPFESTTHFELMVHFMVFNHLNTSVYLTPSNTDESKQLINHCQPNKKVPIVFANLDGKFTFSIEGYENCLNVDLLNQTTTVFRLLSKKQNVPDFFIQLDVLKEENGFCGHLSYPTFPSPTVITNMISNQVITIDQKRSSNKKYPMLVNSMSTSLFAKPQPFVDRDENTVVIGIKTIETVVCFTTDVEPQAIPNSNYFYEVRTTNRGDKMIIIGDQDSFLSISEQSLFKKADQTPLLNVHLNKIEISFIDNYMHELFIIVIKNIIFKLKPQKSIKFIVDSFHVNDMFIASKSPVVVCEEELNFFTLKLKSNLPLKMHSFESIDIKIAPIHIFVDIKFILDICFALNGFLENFKFEVNQIKTRKEVDENKLRRFSFYSVKKLMISPIRFEFTFVKSKGRLNRVPLPQKKNFILSLLIKNVFYIPLETHKEFTGIKMHHIRAPIHNFINSLMICYLNQVTQADIYNLVFRDSSLFNLSMTENFLDFIDDIFNDSNSNANSANSSSSNKANRIIAKPERIPRAFPLNRIVSASSGLNNDPKNNYCYSRYSLAQFVFQKTHPYESLLSLVDSKSNHENRVLVIFNHYIVVLSDNLQFVKMELKIDDLLSISHHANLLFMTHKNNQKINFVCEDDHEARLIVTIIRSLADRMQLFCE